ncbi:hypothetical protein [Aliiroseovarius sp. YM-037]|uniref:hypothetical protein n=1 Tax=Aliiroseovarius sp. YM-037 TaxID=3341728 RepID=UPI003A809D9B
MLAEGVEKDIGAGKVIERRNPAPELLSGQPMVFQGALAGLSFKKKYRVVTLSFHRDDIDVAAFNSGDPVLRQQVAAAVELVFETAFAGVPLEARPPHLVTTHTHLGRLEVNIAVPRFVLSPEGKIRSINPHPMQRGCPPEQIVFRLVRKLLNVGPGKILVFGLLQKMDVNLRNAFFEDSEVVLLDFGDRLHFGEQAEQFDFRASGICSLVINFSSGLCGFDASFARAGKVHSVREFLRREPRGRVL